MPDLGRLRKLWLHGLHHGIDHADNYRRLNVLYLWRNPWGFTDPREQMRFIETNRILLREFGPVATLLEIGCAEGHQTLHLMQVCHQLYGLDVSPRAIRRAKRRCPEAAFVSGDLTNVGRFVNAPQQFDVVVACEVLYYIEDVPKVLKEMSGLGRHCLVTYYSSHREKLDRELGAIHFAGRETIRCDDHSWSVVWWRNY
jgi:2-polyprenyl-3-methyl-5-hydroxy-6-metoxy-1,4-benzoquinol methylase